MTTAIQYKCREEVEEKRLAAKGLTNDELLEQFKNECSHLATQGCFKWLGFPFISVTTGVDAHLEFSQSPGEEHLMFQAEWYQVLKEEILRRMAVTEN